MADLHSPVSLVGYEDSSTVVCYQLVCHIEFSGLVSMTSESEFAVSFVVAEINPVVCHGYNSVPGVHGYKLDGPKAEGRAFPINMADLEPLVVFGNDQSIIAAKCDVQRHTE